MLSKIVLYVILAGVVLLTYFGLRKIFRTFSHSSACCCHDSKVKKGACCDHEEENSVNGQKKFLPGNCK